MGEKGQLDWHVLKPPYVWGMTWVRRLSSLSRRRLAAKMCLAAERGQKRVAHSNYIIQIATFHDDKWNRVPLGGGLAKRVWVLFLKLLANEKLDDA